MVIMNGDHELLPIYIYAGGGEKKVE